ncbi:MAG: molybdate ABC transporter substrate-binding protein [Campylobacterales bacterium]|nr:molybdate ABC transporter substrate-binding protein [Campylobacterales bacterium]
MLKIFLINVLFVGLLQADSINVAVAANVSYAMDDLKKEFNKMHPDTDVKVTLGSSGKLTAQIKNGAPYDLFMSANMKYPNALLEDKIAVTKPVVYAKGSLAILSVRGRDFSKGLELLTDGSIKKIAIANPKTAPYGKAAFEAVKNCKLENELQNKWVYGESISQTVAYTMTAADVGFIAKSSLYSPKMSHFKEGVNWVDVDAKLYTPIEQGIVALKDKKEVMEFYDFILSDKAKEIFKNYGYLVP